MEENFDLIGYIEKKHPELTEQMIDEQLKANEDFVEYLIETDYFTEKK